MIFIISIKHDAEHKTLELLMNAEQDELEMICIHFRRDENFDEALNRGKEKININLQDFSSSEVYQGYLYDPRQTDHAWVDAKAILFFSEKNLENKVSKNLAWKVIDHNFINNLYSSYGYILRKALTYVYEKELVNEDFVAEIIEKTG